jgi:hypothetical protein
MSTERVKYLPYVYFKLKPDNKEIQKNGIQILMKGYKDLKDFINDAVFYEKTFYIVDIEFWKNWQEEVKWHTKEEAKVEENKQDHKEINLKINLSSIMDNYNGKLKQGLVYQKDFVIVTPK